MNNELTNEYYLERFLLGELSEEESVEIQKRISEDVALQTKIEELESSNRAILARYLPSNVRAQIENRIEEARHFPPLSRLMIQFFSVRRIIYVSSVFVSAVLILLFIQPGRKDKIGTLPFDSSSDISLVKGLSGIDFSTTQLLVFRKSRDSVEILHDGNRAKVGDLLQLAYIAAQKKYGMILSLDALGNITLHLPSSLSGSTELEIHTKAFLPFAIELDDAPDFERFLFITSDSPIDVAHVLSQARKLASDPVQAEKGRLDLPQDFNQYSVLILKGEDS
jgi:hypothetical protein